LGGDAFEKPLQEALNRRSSGEDAPVSREGNEHRGADQDQAVADGKRRDLLASPEGRARHAEKGTTEAKVPDERPSEEVTREALSEVEGGHGPEGEVTGKDIEEFLLQEVLAVGTGAEELPAPGAKADEAGNSPDSMKDLSALKGEAVVPGQEKDGNVTVTEGTQLPAGGAGVGEKIFSAAAGEEALPAPGTEAEEPVGFKANMKDVSGLQGEEPVPVLETGGKAVAAGEGLFGAGETDIIEEVLETETGEENSPGLKVSGPETGGKGAVAADAQIRAGGTGVVAGTLETEAKGEVLPVAGEAEEGETWVSTDKGKGVFAPKGDGAETAAKAGEALPGPEVDAGRIRGRDIADSRSQGGPQGHTATGEGAADTPDSETGGSNRDGAGAHLKADQTMAAEGAGLKEASLPADGPGGETTHAVNQGKGEAQAKAEPVAGKPTSTVSGSEPRVEVNLRHLQSPSGGRGIQGALPSQVHMEIHEPDLGRMHWSLITEDGRVTAKAMVDTTRLQELLQGHQDLLQDSLKKAGLEMDGFDVWVGSGSREFFSSLKQSHTGTGAREPETGPEPDDSKGEEVRGDTSSSQGLDLFA